MDITNLMALMLILTKEQVRTIPLSTTTQPKATPILTLAKSEQKTLTAPQVPAA